ncbi:MAG TPA: methyltransferase [Ramlibacter sp.]|nr:methyltransferase [Ramlibacter sp.]
MSSTFEQAREFFLRGVGHYEAGELAQAERAFAAALALVPGRVSTLTNLGAVRLKLGRAEEAAALLEEALAQEPSNTEALRHRAAALAELGDHEGALAAIDRALALQPIPAAWTLRGSILRTLGRTAEAAQSYGAAAATGDTELNRFFLASLTGREPPRAAPREYVESLFDRYAHEFEAHVVDALKYRAPEILVHGLDASARYEAALDLGCGTGLCGALLRPLAKRLDGVDLSGKMVERARATGCYDEVVHADAVQFLERAPRAYDLVIAADVFVYLGALEPVFAAAAGVLSAGGRFCFCVELAPGGADVVLQPTMRYAHSADYILKAVQQSGFEISATAEHAIRADQGAAIPGLFFWLVRS